MTNEELWQLFPIILKEHSCEYDEWYSIEEKKLKEVLGKDLHRINHIGSSAVKGLISKPTVDILIEVEEDVDIKDITKKILDAGWLKMNSQTEPYFSIYFNKGYTEEGFAEKVYHLHLRYLGDWDEIYFRDYLINHLEVAREYENLKKELLKKYENDWDVFKNGKKKFF
jgi:GrpB-like predicted nucleotidyltransferase (UPF0157 family)